MGVPIIIAVWLASAAVLGWLGTTRGLAFTDLFFVSFWLSPVSGLIVLVANWFGRQRPAGRS